MNLATLKINGRVVEGLPDSGIKISVNNVSPITMSGDSIAFSATLKVPKTANNDEIFRELNSGFHTCVLYNAELTIRSLPFAYAGMESSSFYAKVSATAKEYSINIIEDVTKWSDTTIPIIYSDENLTSSYSGGRIYNLRALLKKNYPGFSGVFPKMYFNLKYSTVDFEGMEKYEPGIQCANASVTWQDDVATGSAEIRPRTYTKGRGGYTYTNVELALDSTTFHRYRDYFFNGQGGQYTYGGFKFEGQPIIMVEFPDGIPTSPYAPTLNIYGNLSRRAYVTNMTGYNRIPGTNIVEYRIPVQSTSEGIAALSKIYPLDDYYIIKRVDGVNTRMKFPDGYPPNIVFSFGKGNLNATGNPPQFDTVQPAVVGFPYSDGKKLVDDLCTAFMWRKKFFNNTLSFENILHEDIRDNTANRDARLVDWSDKFVSLETTEVPDVFADSYVAKIGNLSVGYSVGAGTTVPSKEIYSTGLPQPNGYWERPNVVFTNRFKETVSSKWIVVGMYSGYYVCMARFLKFFRDRVQVKIKARLNYEDVKNLRLDYAYYFTQLGGYFYLKDLSEYDVSKGDCKLTLYKLNLN